MEITDINVFLTYYSKIRERTLKVVACIPKDKIEWTYKHKKFTFGDIIRHLATIERYMYAENAQFNPGKYPGCGKELASGYDNVLKFFNQLHNESIEIFSKLNQEDLDKKCVTPGGTPITLWKWLRAMIEHEIHHRGQLYMYLAILDIPTPPLYGLTSEEVQKRSQKNEIKNIPD